MRSTRTASRSPLMPPQARAEPQTPRRALRGAGGRAFPIWWSVWSTRRRGRPASTPHRALVSVTLISREAFPYIDPRPRTTTAATRPARLEEDAPSVANGLVRKAARDFLEKGGDCGRASLRASFHASASGAVAIHEGRRPARQSSSPRFSGNATLFRALRRVGAGSMKTVYPESGPRLLFRHPERRIQSSCAPSRTRLAPASPGPATARLARRRAFARGRLPPGGDRQRAEVA